MAALVKRLLGLDANILFDLAHNKRFANSFREALQAKGYSLKVPPTVIEELTYYALDKSCAETPYALKASQQLRNWGISPAILNPADRGISEAFSNKMILKGFLPDVEFHDGLIFLAEASLAGIPVLATSDHHLLDIEPAYLKIQFEDSDLIPVAVFHPKTLFNALK